MITSPEENIEFFRVGDVPLVPSETTTAGTGSITIDLSKKKRKTRSYKSEYRKAVKECEIWRKAFKAMTWIAGALLLVILFGDWIIKLIV